MEFMLRSAILFLLFLQLAFGAKGQSYEDSLKQYRDQYIKDLLAEPRKPVQPSQVKYISFFKPDKNYCVWATLTVKRGTEPFLVNTHSGKQKPFKEYGILSFTLNGTPLQLHVYQSVDMLNSGAHKDELFVPFNDETNYDQTYGGGRYIDLSLNDVKDDKILLDLNKCYNPYCAYSDGFSCPIPPTENRLHVEINAGEKKFQH